MVGESYCYVSRLRDGSSGSFCKSAARRYTGCADVPEAGYVNCWCSDGDGQVTVSCDQI